MTCEHAAHMWRSMWLRSMACYLYFATLSTSLCYPLYISCVLAPEIFRPRMNIAYAHTRLAIGKAAIRSTGVHMIIWVAIRFFFHTYNLCNRRPSRSKSKWIKKKLTQHRIQLSAIRKDFFFWCVCGYGVKGCSLSWWCWINFMGNFRFSLAFDELASK